MDVSGNGHSNLLYRILNINEYDCLKPIFDGLHFNLPHRQLSVAAIAESPSEGIVGGAVLQTVLHMEPWWVKEGWKGKVSLPSLQNLLEDRARKSMVFPGYLVTIAGEREGSLAAVRGLVKLPNASVWVREFNKA
jgi:hypothetical protein